MPCYVGLGRPGPNIAFGRRGVAPPNPATAGWVEPRGGCAHSSQPQSRTLAPNQASPHPAMLAPAAPTQTLRLGGVCMHPVAAGQVEPHWGCAHSSQPHSRVLAPNQVSPCSCYVGPGRPDPNIAFGRRGSTKPCGERLGRATSGVCPLEPTTQPGCRNGGQPPRPLLPLCAAAAYPAATRPAVAWPPPTLVVPALGGDKGGLWAAAVSASARCNTAHYPSC